MHRQAGRAESRHAREVLATDNLRPPVLLLRAFDDDEMAVGPGETLEEILATEFAKLGPLIAVGRPGERFPPKGAARLWLADASWQSGVDLLLQECQLIVMVMASVGRRP